MYFHEDKSSIRLEDSSNTFRPRGEIGEPDHRSIGTKHDIKALGLLSDLLQPIIHVHPMEGRGNATSEREDASCVDGSIANINARDDSTQLGQAERLLPTVTLQMDDG